MALRVLLADESSTIKRVMQLSLQDFGVEVKAVPVGLDVLPVTKTFKPDIIFADVLITKKNGYEICAELKADAETQNIPVVLMWSGFMEIDDAKMTQAGPDARLEKPFDADALRQLVQDLVPKTQNNPVSAYLQFPKMPEFSEPAPTPVAPAPTPMASKPSLPGAQPQSMAPAAKPSGKIPDAAPINFDQFNPDAEEESIYGIPEESFSNYTRTSRDLPMVESEDANPEESLLVAEDEEFASVPLKSEQQKDQLEDDGWQRQDLKKFKIQTPVATPASKPAVRSETAGLEDDFARKFVIPQDKTMETHTEVDGEFEELSFGEDLTSTRTEDTKRASMDSTRIITKASPKASPAAAQGAMSADSDMIERVIREEAREVIESICWKVIPEMAERIVREEISKILRDVEKST